MSEYDYILTSAGELYHYGVLGMKWGVRRAQRKSAQNERLASKALDYDKRSAKLAKKAEKQHSKNDLERANRVAIRGANYFKKAAVAEKKALRTENESKRLRLESKAAELKYKGAKTQAKANRISKTTGYGAEAMKYSIKSDNVAAKAAKARMKIAANKAYIESMNRKLSTLDAKKLKAVEEPFSKYLRESFGKVG